MFKIAEAAKFLGVSRDTLRRWEKIGKIHSVRTPSGYRVYELAELERVKNGQTLGNLVHNHTYLINNDRQGFEDLGLEQSKRIIEIEHKRLTGQTHTLFPNEEILSNLISTEQTNQLIEKDKRNLISSKSGLSILIVVILLAGFAFPIKLLHQSISRTTSDSQLAAGFSSQDKLGSVLAASSPTDTLLVLNTDTEVDGTLTV